MRHALCVQTDSVCRKSEPDGSIRPSVVGYESKSPKNGYRIPAATAAFSDSTWPRVVVTVIGAKLSSTRRSHGSVRISLGKSNTQEEIDYLIEIMPPIVARMRSMSPLYAGAK